MTRGLARRLSPDVYGALGSVALVGIAFYGMAGRTGASWIFPRVLAWTLLGFSVLLLIRALVHSERVRMWQTRQVARDVLVFVLGVLVFLLAIPRLGFWIPSFITVTAAITLLGEDRSYRTLLKAAMGALIVVVIFYFVFFETFNVRLPQGSWLRAIGLVS
jgi:hypothetical protein